MFRNLLHRFLKNVGSIVVVSGVPSRFRFRFRFRLILFCQHTTFSNSNVYTNNEIIKYADMEAPIKTSYGRYHRATRKIN